MKEFAIIVAGGVGSRMGTEIPKQFLLIDGVPIIVQTINQFILYNKEIQVILVLPADHISRWSELKGEYLPDTFIQVASGGSTRTESVIAGLKLVNEMGLVAVHDAVRPFVSKEIIANSFLSAAKHGSGVTAVAMKDSIRELAEKSSVSRDRSNFVLVQTPQTFKVDKLKKAYELVDNNVFTDDATVYEQAGFAIHLVEGSYSNIKITTPEDLA